MKLFLLVEGAYETQSEVGVFSDLAKALDAAAAVDDPYGWTVNRLGLDQPNASETICWTDGRHGAIEWAEGWSDPREVDAVGPEG